MKISDMLKYAQGQLEIWAKTQKGGRARIAADPVDLLEILTNTPGGICAAIMFHSEQKRGIYEESGGVDRTFWVAITRGRGMRLHRGEELVQANAGGPPLYDLLEEARQQVRALQFDAATTEVSPDYKGTRPIQVEGYLLDAYIIEFSIFDQLPAPPAAS